MDEELQKLYNAVSSNFDIGTYDQFKGKMQTPEDRRKFYDVVSSQFDIGDYESYEGRLGSKKKESTVSGSGSIAPISSMPSGASQENDYSSWLKRNNITDVDQSGQGIDYDYQSFYRDNKGSDITEGQHLTDTYKLPNHPTFSKESKASRRGQEGGEWSQDENGRWTFKASEFNLSQRTPEELSAYFREVEPNSRLVLPDGTIAKDFDNADYSVQLQPVNIDTGLSVNDPRAQAYLGNLQAQQGPETPMILSDQGQQQYTANPEQFRGIDTRELNPDTNPGFLASVANSARNVWTRLQGAVPRLNVVSADLFENVFGKEIARKIYENDPIRNWLDNPETLDEVRNNAYQTLEELNKEVRPTQGLVENITSGNIQNIPAAAIDAVSSLISTAIPAALTGGAGLYTEMVGDAIVDYNQQKAKQLGLNIDQLYDQDKADIGVPLVTGVLSGALEHIGLKGVQGAINRKLTGGFAKRVATIIGDANKEGITEFLQTGLEEVNRASGEGDNIENASKKGIDKMFSKEGLESYLMGAVGSLGATGIGRLSRNVISRESNDAIQEAAEQLGNIEQELANPEVSEATKSVLNGEAEQIKSTAVQAVMDDFDRTDHLSAQQQDEISDQKKQMEDVQTALADPNISESTRTLLEDRAKSINDQIQSIAETVEPFEDNTSLELDERIRNFQERFPNRTVDVLEDLPESVVNTFERVESNVPTDPVQLQEASDWLYNKYQQLTAMKQSTTRMLTTEQINAMQEQLGEDITTLENYKNAQREQTEVQPQGEVTSEPISAPQTTVSETGQEGRQEQRINERLVGNKYTDPDNNEYTIRIMDGPRGEVDNVNDIVDKDRLSLSVRSSDGETVGTVSFWKDKDGRFYSNMTNVKKEFRRKGIATAMYDFAKSQGYDIKSSTKRTEAGNDFTNRYFNQQNEYVVPDPNEQSVLLRRDVTLRDLPSEQQQPESDLQSSYNRLTEGMTAEQINSDPDLVRMRDRINQLSSQTEISSGSRGRIGKMVEDYKGEKAYEMLDKDGNVSGQLVVDSRDGLDNVVSYVNVNKDKRNQGIATDAYIDYVNKFGELWSTKFKNITQPSETFTNEAKSVWKKLEGFGARPVKVNDTQYRYHLTKENLLNSQEQGGQQNAVQEQSTDEMGLRQQRTVGERMGRRNAQQERSTRENQETRPQEVPENEEQEIAPRRTIETRFSTPEDRNAVKQDALSKVSESDNEVAYKATVDYATAAIADGEIDSPQSLANAIGTELNKSVRDAYKEAKTIVDANDSLAKTSVRNADTATKRREYGFNDPLPVTKQTNEETLKKASDELDSGYYVPDLIDKINNGTPITDVESAILTQYVAAKEAEIINLNKKVENSNNKSGTEFQGIAAEKAKATDELIQAYDAAELAGTMAGRALQARKIMATRDYSLANMYIMKRRANGNATLTARQMAEVEAAHKALQEKEKQYVNKINQLEEENKKLQEKAVTDRLREEVQSERRRSNRVKKKADILSERENLIADLAKAWNQKKSGNVGFAYDPNSQAENDVNLTKILRQLARNYIEGGMVDASQFVDDIYSKLSGTIKDITKRDIRDAIIGANQSEKPPLSDLRRQIRDFRTELDLINRIEDVEKGIKRTKEGTAARDNKNQRLEELRNRLRQLLAASQQEVPKTEKQLAAYKSRVQKQINDIRDRINKKDYDKREPVKLEMDYEAKKLRDEYRKIKFDFDVAVKKDQLANRSKIRKYYDTVINTLGIPRALMATADFSAPLRQGLWFIGSRPVTSSKAFVEMFRQAFSQTRADNWLEDFRSSPGYELAKQSGLAITETNNVDVTAKEEEFMTNIAEEIKKVPVVGKVVGAIIGGAERAYSGYLNKMRADVFSHGVELLQNDGITPVNNIKAYKALAAYINAGTGRGNLPESMKLATGVLNQVLFSPRLMASRIELLTNPVNPKFWARTPRAVRQMYVRDLAGFLGFGASMIGLAASYAALTDDDEFHIEDDPRSTDYGKIRYGDKRYDIWGGFQQYVRLMARIISGESVSSTGNVTPLDGTSYSGRTRLTELAQFVRGKLSPIAAYGINAIDGKDMMGVPFDAVESAGEMLWPLTIQDTWEAFRDEGPSALATVWLPTTFGVGYQNYKTNEFLNTGPDDKVVSLLNSKKAVAVEPYEERIRVYDIKTGEDRGITSSEYKKYYQVWSDHIKNDLKNNLSEYEKMGEEKFRKKFNSIKSKATVMAKEAVSGVSVQEKTIRSDGKSYALTPDQIKIRQDLNKEFKQRREGLFSRLKQRFLRSGMPEYEADMEARKEVNREANEYSKERMLNMNRRKEITLTESND